MDKPHTQQPHKTENAHGLASRLKPAAEACEHATKVAAVVLGLLYVVGLMTVNLYLDDIGVSDFSIFRTRYILTGVLALAVFVGTVIGAFYCGLSAPDHPRTWKGRLKELIRVVPVFLPPLIFWGVWLYIKVWWGAPYADFSLISFDISMTLLWLAGVQALAYLAGKGMHGEEKEETAAKVFGMCLVLFLSLGMFVSLFSTHAYAWISPSLGGGESQRVRLLLAADKLASCRSVGIPVRPDLTMSFPIDILHEGEKSFVVKTDDKIVALDKSLVLGFRIKPSGHPRSAGEWEREEAKEWGQSKAFQPETSFFGSMSRLMNRNDRCEQLCRDEETKFYEEHLAGRNKPNSPGRPDAVEGKDVSKSPSK